MSGSVSGGTTVGSGSDSIVLSMSEDSAVGTDALFTVNVDGQQIGGEQTVTASHGAGQQQTFTFLGNYGAGQHTVTVTFANNFLMPGQSGDRNLYVNSLSYDGQNVSNSTKAIYESPLFPPNSDHDIYGNANFTVNDTTPTSAGNNSTTPGTVSIGSGSDTLVLKVAEDEYQGDAQFTVSVDGKQVGGTQTTTAHLADGQAQEFDVHGNWGSGSHNVTVTYLNDHIGDFYPGTQLAVDTTDRNLYVMGLKLNDGDAASGTPWELDSTGSKSFSVTAGSGGGSSGSSSGSQASAGSSNSNSGSSGSQTSDNASINGSSLSSNSSGSSSGMSFMSSGSSASSASGSGGSDASSGSSNNGSGSSNQSSSNNTGSVVASGSQSSNDWAVPGSSDSGGDNTGSTRSSHGHWSGNHADWHAKWVAHSQG